MKAKKLFRVLLVAVLSLTYFLIPVAAVIASSLLISFENSGSDYRSIYTSGTVFAQSFKTGTTGIDVDHIDLYLWRKGTTGDVVLNLYLSGGGANITGSVLATDTIDATTEVIAYTGGSAFPLGDYWVPFDLGNYGLSANTTYVVTANVSGWAGDINNNTVRWGRNSSGGYSDGQGILYNGTWQADGVSDQFFRLYGGQTTDIFVTTHFAYTKQDSISSNWTAYFNIDVFTLPIQFDVDTVSVHLGLQPNNWTLDGNILNRGSSPIVHYTNGIADNNSIIQYDFYVDGYLLTDNTTYYYQGYVIEDGITYLGNIQQLTTKSTGFSLPDLPTIRITKIKNVSSEWSSEYIPVIELTAKIYDTDLYRIDSKGFYFSLSQNNNVLSPPIGEIRNFENIALDGTFIVNLRLGDDPLHLEWTTNQPIYTQAYAKDSEVGIGYSSVVTLTASDLRLPDANVGTDLTQVIKDAKKGLGLKGIFGSWAFMFLIVIMVALGFGIAYMETKEKTGKIALGFSWFLAEVCVVGGFIFTGELGIWTVFVATGAVATLILIVMSSKLSGSGGEI